MVKFTCIRYLDIMACIISTSGIPKRNLDLGMKMMVLLWSYLCYSI